MRVIVSNIIQIDRPTNEIIKYCRESLSFRNPEYFKKQQMGFRKPYRQTSCKRCF